MVELNDQNIKAIFDMLDDAVELASTIHGNSKYYDLGYSVQAVVSTDEGGYVAFREVKSEDGKHYTERFLQSLKVYGFTPKDEWIAYKPFSNFHGNNIFEVAYDIALQLMWEHILEYDSEVMEDSEDDPNNDEPISLKIYVASSWRNEYQQQVVKMLREWGHEVYDFKHPEGKKSDGFRWNDVDENWQHWTPREYQKHLKSEKAQYGFNRDFKHLKWADVCVLVLPCGSSAHAEAGWMKGVGRPTFVYIPEGIDFEPELMYNLFDGVAVSDYQLWKKLNYCGSDISREPDIFQEYKNRNGNLKVPKVEVWNLDNATTYWLYPRIKALVEDIQCSGATPWRCVEEFGEEESWNKYNEILHKILAAFEQLHKETVGWEESEESPKPRSEENDKIIKEGLALFADYYETLGF